jgi:transcriptional regulator with PAS, ATPase and Fis domain
MVANAWIREFRGAVIVCDEAGTITEMNDRAVSSYSREGGKDLIGKNVLDCHPEPARARLAVLMTERKTNIYTIEKAGKKKIICQVPWTVGGEYRGFVELSLEIPFEMPHFMRQG